MLSLPRPLGEGTTMHNRMSPDVTVLAGCTYEMLLAQDRHIKEKQKLTKGLFLGNCNLSLLAKVTFI